MQKYDVVVIGGGPAGLAAAISADKCNVSTLVIEREERLGGILKQCIHDGFGIIRFNERLTGPEYAENYIEMLKETKVQVLKNTFVKDIQKQESGFILTIVNAEGITKVSTTSLILATGCRERTAKQISIHGSRPAGVYTAGTAQHFVNLMGVLPCKKCVILGSGDIGLIMARRLTLEGAEVVGVYEAKATPSGLTRNIHQCLNDFNIPLHLSHTVTNVIGEDRVKAVEVAKVDENMNVIKGSERIVECDAVILSVGLIPENEVAQSLDILMDKRTKGPLVDQELMTSCKGVFSCGNALHVNDLVDYVSESAELAGKYAARHVAQGFSNKEIGMQDSIDIHINNEFLYLVPQKVNLDKPLDKIITYFRSSQIMKDVQLTVLVDGKPIIKKKYTHLKPPEMERLVLDLSKVDVNKDSTISMVLEDKKNG